MESTAYDARAQPSLAPLPRFAGALATWALLFVASPGIVTRGGLWFVALVALVPWALACSRPGRFAFGVEWLAAAIGISSICFWSTYVIWLTLLAVSLVPATYMTFAGVVLRRIARRWPLAVAVPAAWIALETLRMVVEPPLGFGWLRLGHHAHAQLWLAGSARVWGTGGIGFAMAAFAGGIADCLRARVTRTSLARPRLVVAAALGPLAFAIATSLLTSPPTMRDGPRVLLVQPGFEQERKMARQTGQEMLDQQLALTREGVAEAARANEPIDILAWGETCMPYDLCDPDLLAAWDRGVRPLPWDAERLDRAYIESMIDAEKIVVGEVLYGRNGRHPILQHGTAFVCGAEHFVEHGGTFRRQNAIVAWDGGGRRAGVGGKVHLVPGGETMSGLERIAWVRDTAFELAGYVPDMLDFDTTAVLTVHGQGGHAWRFGATVCFDNAFEGPYVVPLQHGELDFHLIASNEAWYRTSWEYDQMMAFSHMIALETGRSFVRATNAGITAVIGPDGRDVARLFVGGRDRMVSGSLRAVVPVPADPDPAAAALPGSAPREPPSPGAAPRPIYVATWRWWLGLWMGLGLVLALTSGARARTAPVTARG